MNPVPPPGDRAENQPMRLLVEIAAGELIDKLTILEIKRERIADPEARANIETEYAMLDAVRVRELPASETLEALTAELRAINEKLWQIEDDIRLCESDGLFDADFVALARSVYRTNDRRAEVKRQINDLLGSRLFEEKSYAG